MKKLKGKRKKAKVKRVKQVKAEVKFERCYEWKYFLLFTFYLLMAQTVIEKIRVSGLLRSIRRSKVIATFLVNALPFSVIFN